MPSLIPSSLPTILQVVEQQLLTSGVVGDISNIYWIFPEEEPKPGATGQRDLLFAIHEEKPVNVEGDGVYSLISSGFDVYLRSTLAADRLGTRRDFMIAHRAIVEGVMNALMDFFPEDVSRNALTNYGIVLDSNAKPTKSRSVATWGETIGTYRLHFLPNISYAVPR
jgi:hypothetical protein